MPTTPSPPHTVESLLRIVEARDAEVALLKLTVDKLKAQLLRRLRAQFGASSEQLGDRQLALIEGRPLDELAPAKTAAKGAAANETAVDRKLPDHLPRDTQVHHPQATDDHRRVLAVLRWLEA